MRSLIFVFGCLIFVTTAAFGQADDLRGDFNGDGRYFCDDVDLLWQEFLSDSPDLATFDLSEDGALDDEDFDALLRIASAQLGTEIMEGDFDFNGYIDRRDFLYVAARYPGPANGYCQGDVNNDGSANAHDTNLLGIRYAGEPEPPKTAMAAAYQRDGDGLILARSDRIELIAIPEPFEDGFSGRLVATRVVARMRDASDEIATVDRMNVAGDLIQVGIPVFGGMETTPEVHQFEGHEILEAWKAFDSHSLIHRNDISVGEFGYGMWEHNDESNPQGIAEQMPSIMGFTPPVGFGSFGAGTWPPHIGPGVRALRRFRWRDEESPPDWTELPLVRVVSLIGDDGRPGSATLSVGLQGIDEHHDPLPEMGIITDVPIPYFLSGRFCDRDFDGDCDLQDLPAESFSEFTSSDIDEWLSDAGTVMGDADLDGDVDVDDLNVVGINWLSNDVGWLGGDFDRNGIVDSRDVNQVGINWQFGVEVQPSAAPEPTGVNLVLACVCFFLARRKQI